MTIVVKAEFAKSKQHHPKISRRATAGVRGVLDSLIQPQSSFPIGTWQAATLFAEQALTTSRAFRAPSC